MFAYFRNNPLRCPVTHACHYFNICDITRRISIHNQLHLTVFGCKSTAFFRSTQIEISNVAKIVICFSRAHTRTHPHTCNVFQLCANFARIMCWHCTRSLCAHTITRRHTPARSGLIAKNFCLFALSAINIFLHFYKQVSCQ